MNRFCSSCGEQARPDDRFCVGCGHEINSATTPATGASFRPPEHRRRRTGSFIVRHARALMALAVVAAIAGAAALSGSSQDTTPTPADAAPAADVAAEQAAQQAVATVHSQATKPRTKAKAAPKPVAVRGSNGKVYMCGPAAQSHTEAKDAIVQRREKVLKRRRQALRALVKKYPGGTAPSSVVDRYEYLRARANAQVKFTNKAISAYNGVLEDECRPE